MGNKYNLIMSTFTKVFVSLIFATIVKYATRKFVANALKKKEEERVGKAIFNSFSLLRSAQFRRQAGSTTS